MRARGTVVALVVLLAVAALPAPSGARGAAPDRPAVAPPAGDPAAPGPDVVDELSYDLGDEVFQPEDLPAKVEVRAKVYAPQTIAGQAPLVLLIHGRHATCATTTVVLLDWPCPAAVPEIPSYAGYDALGHLLASHGMVVASIGANGINANDGYVMDGGAAARAELLLEHLRLWDAWSTSDVGSPFGSRFVGHVDLGNVGLMGHSRGGEGAVAGALLNQRIGSPYGIRAVEALAPVDFGRQVLGAIPLGVILPYCDGDVFDLQGARLYDDARYANPGDPAPKQTTLLHGANHNFFNTVWTTGPGAFDDAGAGGEIDGAAARAAAAPVSACAPGGTGRLVAGDQELAGAALMAGFFRRYLLDDASMQRLVTGTAPFPASTGPARWSVAYHEPNRLDIERFDTPNGLVRDRHDGPVDIRGLSTASICRADSAGEFEPMPERGRDVRERCESSGFLALVNSAGVFDAGWIRSGASVGWRWDGGLDTAPFDGLRFRVGVVGDSRNDTRPKQDVTVTVVDANGVSGSVQASSFSNAFFPIPPNGPRHAVLTGVRIPFAAFPGLDLSRVRSVKLTFDRTGAGRLAVADVAFTAEGTGDAAGPNTGATVDPTTRPVCRRTAANRWGCAIAQILWGRDPSGSDLAWLSAGYRTAERRAATIRRAVLSGAAMEVDFTRFIQRYTGSEVGGGNATFMVSGEGRRSWEAARIELTETLAYSTSRLSTPAKVVEATYLAFIGQKPDAAGRAYWTPRVQLRGPRALAASLVRTERARRLALEDRYQQILGRAPDPGGATYWMARLLKTDGERLMVRSFMQTESFRKAASS